MLADALQVPAILLSGSCALFLTASAHGQTETFSEVDEGWGREKRPITPATKDAVPDGLSNGDWAGIRAAYEAGRHAVRTVEDGYQARNPGQAWRTHFDGRGFLTEPDAGGWTWGLELVRYGFAGSAREVTRPACVSAEGGRVVYTWDATLEEWYSNDTRGLEHGYTIHSRPPREGGDEKSPLTITLAVRGELRAEVVDDGRGVRFLDEGGKVALTYTGLSVLDADGRKLEASFEARFEAGDRLILSVDERDARYPIVIDPTAQQAYLKASNTDANYRFGTSVRVSGDTVVVGAPYEDSNATGVNGNQSDNSAHAAGAAYVFVRSGASWSQEGYLKASNTDSDDRFGGAVAVSGDTVVVGASRERSSAAGVDGDQGDNSTHSAGAAYVFVRIGTRWSQDAYLKASNTEMGDRFGASVAVSDGTIVVGASSEDSSATGVNGNQSDNSAQSSGAAYVFVLRGTSWIQQAYLKASNTDIDDQFAVVAVSGDTVIVGAKSEDSNASGVNGNQYDDTAGNAGAAYVFARAGTSWSQEGYLKASNTGTEDYFGLSVAVSGDTVVVGAPGEDSSATGVNGNQSDNSAPLAGAAYVFVRSGKSWSQEAYLKASNTDIDDRFGVVAVSGDIAVIGAPGQGGHPGIVGGNPDSGAAYGFVRNGTDWSQGCFLKASNIGMGDAFGVSVAVSANTVVVGAWLEDSNATGVDGNQSDNSAANAGAAYVYVTPGTSYCVALANSTGNPTHIFALGSARIIANIFLLYADHVPANQTGAFFYGPEQTQVPFGNGFLCVGPGATGIARFHTVSADGFGMMTQYVDFSAPPTAATQITAGSTWNFQAWFRDPLEAPAFFNLSDGLEVTFEL